VSGFSQDLGPEGNDAIQTLFWGVGFVVSSTPALRRDVSDICLWSALLIQCRYHQSFCLHFCRLWTERRNSFSAMCWRGRQSI